MRAGVVAASAARLVDVAVVGGGPVGAATAVALAQQGVGNVAVIDRTGPTARPPPAATPSAPFENRVFAIAPRSVRLLERIGAWQIIEQHGRARVVERMRMRDALAGRQLLLNAATDGAAPYACQIVESSWLSYALGLKLAEANVRVLRANLTDVSLSNRWAELTLDEGESPISARLIVGADGQQSLVRRRANIPVIQRDYNRKAVVATLRVANEHADAANEAVQRFLPGGPVALLPLAPGWRSLVWTTTPDRAARLVAAPASRFIAALETALHAPLNELDLTADPLDAEASSVDFAESTSTADARETSDGRHGDLEAMPHVVAVVDGSRAAFPLKCAHAERLCGSRFALAGDAARQVHPLAGQGLNLGLADAEVLSNYVSEAVRNGQDAGSLVHLLHYERDRQAAAVPMQMLIHSIEAICGSSSHLMSAGRYWGWAVMENSALLRRTAMSFAMG